MTKINLPFRRNGALNTRAISDEMASELRHETNLNSENEISQVAYHYVNELLKIPTCICGNELTFKGFGKGYSASCGNKNCKDQVAKQTLLDNHGVVNVAQMQKTKDAIAKSLSLKTEMQRLEIQQKTIATNNEKYGVDYPTQNNEIIKKRQLSNLQKYGVKEPIQLAKTQDKIKQNNIEKYGVEYPSQLTSNRDKYRKTRKSFDDSLRPNRILFDTPENCEKIYNEIGNLSIIAEKFDVGHTWLSRRFRQLNLNVAQPKVSAIQREVFEYIKSLGIDAIENDRSIISPLEIDILIPNKLAIEIDGIYWHSYDSIEMQSEKCKHLLKLEICESRAKLPLMRFTDLEWRDKSPILKSMIAQRLGFSANKIYGRNCEVESISNTLCKEFLDENHLQGSVSGPYKFGLFNNGILVGVAVFGKSRFSSKAEWELLRLCYNKYTSVVGGLGKFLKAFRKLQPNGKIISYSTRDKFSGQSYEANNFSFLYHTPPSYYYWKGENVYSRFQMQKHKLAKKLNNFNPERSEAENCFNNGFSRYWDCGMSVWILN